MAHLLWKAAEVLDWHASVYGSRTGNEGRYGTWGSRRDGFDEDGGVVYGRQSVISDHALRRLAGSVYVRAKEVASSGRMHRLLCRAIDGSEGSDLVLSAQVGAADRYADDYEVGVTIDQQDDDLRDAHCTCPAFGRYGHVCKHVVALAMIYNQQPDRFEVSGHNPRRRPQGATSRMLSSYMRSADTKRRIEAKQRHLELLQGVDHADQVTDGNDADELWAADDGVDTAGHMPDGSVSLRVRLDHGGEGWNIALHIVVPRRGISYVVKDIAVFAHAVRLQEFMRYGKHLGFVHTRDVFDDLGKRVLDVIDRAVDIRDSVLIGQRIGLRREYARGAMALSDGETAELLAIHVGTGIPVEYASRAAWSVGDSDAVVIDGDPDLGLKIEPHRDATEAVGGDDKDGFGPSGYIIRHTRSVVDSVSGQSGDFVIVVERSDRANGVVTVHRCSERFYRNRALAQALCGSGDDDELFLARDDVDAFSRTVLPSLDAGGDADSGAGLAVTLPDELLTRRRDECRIKIYLDRDQSIPGITCDVQAWYADRSFHVFDGIGPGGITDGVVRDQDAERLAVAVIRRYFPMPVGRIAVIPERDDHAIYRLLTEGLQVLHRLGEVYATPAFDGLSVVQHPIIRLGLTMRSGLVEISPIADEIDPKDVPALLNSYHKRRRCHRLHDGSFVDLRSVDTSALAEVGADLGIKASKLEAGAVTVPAYEAYYLDHQVREDDKSPEFTAYLNDLRVVDPHAYRVPQRLSHVLRPYQCEGYRWLCAVCDKGFGGILADEMGLGKTVQLLSLLVARRGRSRAYGPNLIICPASLVYNWTAECEKFAPELQVVAVAGSKAARREALRSTKAAYQAVRERGDSKRRDAAVADVSVSSAWQGATAHEESDVRIPDVLVTSYDLLRRDIDEYEGLECYCMTLDEAQYIKNHSTLSARAARAVSAKHRFALTGTPIENRLSELWSIFDFLMPGMLGSYTHFRQRFEMPILSGDTDAQAKLQAFVTPFILRRLKTDVVKDLPDKIENVITVQLQGEQRRLYAALEQRLRASLLRQRDMEFATGKIQILAQLTRLRQVCCDPRLLYTDVRDDILESENTQRAIQASGGMEETSSGGRAVHAKVSSAKLDAIEELVESCQDAGRKMLIFSQFTSYLDLIAQRLREREVRYDVITGATPKRRRIELVNQFNHDETPVFLISLKAGNTGLNLTGACVVVHADPWWNAAAQEQATDRAHRIGQTQDVNVYQIVAKDTIEERIVNLQHEKSDLASRFVDSSSSTTGGSISGLTKDDLLALLG